jgi:NodT family efflux transporter outer membrane factor (OMF) lipoprotein
MRLSNKISALLLATLLSGCSLAPNYARPDVNAPAAWSVEQQTEETKIAAAWWRGFQSEELNDLMLVALDRNNDIRASLARVEQARAGLKISGASLWPSADATGGLSRTRSNPANGGSTTENAWRAGAGISYELDLFGANRAGVDAAEAQLLGSQFDQQALALVVMGDVAKGYFSVLNLRERLSIAKENQKNARDVMDIVQSRFDAGAASALVVSQQKSALANNDASVASLENQVKIAENALSVLLGEAPQQRGFTGDSLKSIPTPVIAPGQPSTLLERRPDIRSAEAALLAANANIDAARAAFFPTISLGLDASINGDPVSSAIGLASSLLVPIFQGGRLEGGVEQATARQVELSETYRKTVLVSFREVEDALSTARAADARQLAFEKSYREAQKSYELSRQLYNAGSIDFQTLLDTQNNLLSAQDSYASIRLEMLSAAIDLYMALGGGWE